MSVIELFQRLSSFHYNLYKGVLWGCRHQQYSAERVPGDRNLSLLIPCLPCGQWPRLLSLSRSDTLHFLRSFRMSSLISQNLILLQSNVRCQLVFLFLFLPFTWAIVLNTVGFTCSEPLFGIKIKRLPKIVCEMMLFCSEVAGLFLSLSGQRVYQLLVSVLCFIFFFGWVGLFFVLFCFS